MNIVFCHGKEGEPRGIKFHWIADVVKEYKAQDFDVELSEPLDFREIPDPDERVKALLASKQVNEKTILVGSSMGGYVCAVASTLVDVGALLLLAPALYMNEIANGSLHIMHKPNGKKFPTVNAKKLNDLQAYNVTQFPPKCLPAKITLIHGNQDDVVPLEGSLKFSTLYDSILQIVPDNHRLHRSKDEIQSALRALIEKNLS